MIVVMGVSGSGKTTVGQALAARLGCPFYDGDDFHPPENVAKMAGGIPLNDEDRAPWLAHLHDLIHDHLSRGALAVLACSALKRRYRDQLRVGNDRMQFVYLHGDFDLIWSRMQTREDHYMKAEMLHSQFDALEQPGPDEAITVSIEADQEQIVTTVLAHLQKSKSEGDPITNHDE
jgi:gluconokinase